MYAYFQYLRVGQHITVYYRHRFESRVAQGSFVGRAHDTLALRCDGQDRDLHIAECDIMSISRQAALTSSAYGSAS